MKRVRAGSSTPTAAMPSRRSSSAWARARCMCRNCRASRASRPSRAIRSTPAGGITITPAAIPRARRWTGSPTSASASSAPGRPPCSACRIWPAPPRNSTCSSARRPPSTSAPTRRSIPTGFRRSPRPAGSSAGWKISPPTRPAATPRRIWSRTAGPTCRGGSAAKIMQLPREQRIRAEHAGGV